MTFQLIILIQTKMTNKLIKTIFSTETIENKNDNIHKTKVKKSDDQTKI